MKKMLFISNITNRITNFSLPSIIASQELGYEFHLAANCSGFKDDAANYNIKVHHIDLVRNPLNPQNIKAYRQLLALIKEENFDVIHCNTPIGGILGRICGGKMKVPKIIYTAHGFHFYEGAPNKNKLYKWAEMRMAPLTDAIITMNNEDFQAAQCFNLRNEGTVHFIPGVGVDTDLYSFIDCDKKKIRNSLNIKDDDIVLIAMGDLIHRKNYEASIRAIAKANNSKLHFLICGQGPKLEFLQSLSRKLGVENQIHFLGFRTDIKDLLDIADIFLFTTYQEGLPRSMMEAMAAGLPCIASKVRGNTDLIENGIGGYLCPPDDFTGFANAINKLSNDEGLRKVMGDKNQEVIKQYDTANVIQVMKKIYKSIQM